MARDDSDNGNCEHKISDVFAIIPADAVEYRSEEDAIPIAVFDPATAVLQHMNDASQRPVITNPISPARVYGTPCQNLLSTCIQNPNDITHLKSSMPS